MKSRDESYANCIQLKKMIHEFIHTCKQNGEKTAFITKRRRVTFSALLSDVYRMVNFFKARNIERGSKALLYALPSYGFYVLLLACIYYGVTTVVPDSYKNRERLLKTMRENDVQYVFHDGVTRLLRSGFPKACAFFNISDFRKYTDEPSRANTDEASPVLTTFTSGTTGEPKPINRSTAFLKEQIESISKNIEIGDSSVVFCGLPIYALFTVYSGRTCVLERKLRTKQIEKHCVDTVLAPIAMLLNAKGRFEGVRNVYCGGARLYQRDAERLRAAFPHAKIAYNYGASECALIGLTELSYYVKHGFAIEKPAKGVTVELADRDENGVGRIVVRGAGVLTENREYVSNDLGRLDEYGLHIVGRSKYSAFGAYNYLLDDEILAVNGKVKRGFALSHGGRIYFCYEGKLSVKKSGVIFVKFRRLPMDAKHKTKLDYAKTAEALEKKIR